MITTTYINKVALDNPDLPVNFIRDILIARSRNSNLAEPFIPHTIRAATVRKRSQTSKLMKHKKK